MNKVAYFAGGCFWCTEAVFSMLKGVVSVTSGYSGGKSKNPTYDEVVSGKSDHAEVARVVYNPKVISFNILLNVFFITHDPTTLNRQGYDVGAQYRSMIFYVDDEQKEVANKFIDDLTKAKVFSNPIVTKVTPFKEFFQAEEYHQKYYAKNIYKAYCRIIISPKLSRLKREYSHFLK